MALCLCVQDASTRLQFEHCSSRRQDKADPYHLQLSPLQMHPEARLSVLETLISLISPPSDADVESGVVLRFAPTHTTRGRFKDFIITIILELNRRSKEVHNSLQQNKVTRTASPVGENVFIIHSCLLFIGFWFWFPLSLKLCMRVCVWLQG